jgi:hypothetical protein
MKKKLMIAVVLVVAILASTGFGLVTASAEEAAPEAPAVVETPAVVEAPASEPAVALLPNSQVQGNAIYLFRAGSLAFGPAIDLAKFGGIVSLQLTFAEIQKKDEGNFLGFAGTVKAVDLIKKLGGNPNDILITVNPSAGFTAGIKVGDATAKKDWDAGIIVNVINLDLAKAANWLGL